MGALNGKVAVVTGAGRRRGIGRAIALRLAQDGADVCASAVHRQPDSFPEHEREAGWRGIESVAGEVEALGVRSLAVDCDVTDAAAVSRLFAETKAQLLRFGPELDGRVFVGYTGVPRQMFRDSKTHDQGPLRVLVLGALSSEKDPLTALRTVGGLDDAHLRMVGSGPMDVSVRQEARNAGMKGRLELVGSVADVSEHLEWADVLLLSSRTEGLPAAILEAGAAGVPSVAFDVGGVREAVVDGITGLVVPAGDTGALMSALKSLDGDRSSISEMGAAARRHVEKNFRLEQAIDKYIHLLTTEPAVSQP